MPDGSVLTQVRGFRPPFIHGTARLATRAFQGHGLDSLLGWIGPEPETPSERAGWLLDRSLAFALCFHADEAAALQAEALSITRVFRLREQPGLVRLLAVMAPGDLMVNAPLDFLTTTTDVQLDLVFTQPDGHLPAGLPDHDVAIVAASELAPDMMQTLVAELADWQRPLLNDPRHIGILARDRLAQALGGLPGLMIAPTVEVSRSALRRIPIEQLLPEGRFPVLLRPVHSHAGAGLMKIESVGDLSMYLLMTEENAFYLTQFIDYRGQDGWFRKYRIAFVDGVPFLCHMAASDHWMVHYLNAGMAESPAKRAAEAAEMAGFDAGFAARHRGTFDAMCGAIGLDYFSVDCSEAPDGRLLVFEADIAAIIHSMDDPELYPYKRAPMQRCYDAFATMLERRRDSQYRV
jgi:hypothetical protein